MSSKSVDAHIAYSYLMLNILLENNEGWMRF